MAGTRPMKPEEWGFPGWLTPDQEKALAELRETLLKQHVFSQKTLMPDKDLLRFLRARDFNVKKTFDMLGADLEWRKAFEGCVFRQPDFPNIWNFAKNGALYRAGTDVSFRRNTRKGYSTNGRRWLKTAWRQTSDGS